MILHCNILMRLSAAAIVLAGLAGAAIAAEPAYLAAVEDMPLPAGLVEDAAAGMAFDKPEGRIVEAVVRGAGSVPQVVAFYRNTLPALGWHAVGEPAALTWRREGETVRIALSEADSTVTLRFNFAPQ